MFIVHLLGPGLGLELGLGPELGLGLRLGLNFGHPLMLRNVRSILGLPALVMTLTRPRTIVELKP